MTVDLVTARAISIDFDKRVCPQSVWLPLCLRQSIAHLAPLFSFFLFPFRTHVSVDRRLSMKSMGRGPPSSAPTNTAVAETPFLNRLCEMDHDIQHWSLKSVATKTDTEEKGEKECLVSCWISTTCPHRTRPFISWSREHQKSTSPNL